MIFRLISRVCRASAIGAILLFSASCISINEELGKNLIPTNQKWDVFNPEPATLEKIELRTTDSLSAYNSSRFTFGSVNDPIFGTCIKGTSFTLVPVVDTMDFGTNTRIKQFHLSAVRDTVSAYYDSQKRILQNVYVTELKAELDTLALYTDTFMSEENRNRYLSDRKITSGTPVYDGGDSLSFNFSRDFTERMVEKLKSIKLDSITNYTKVLPGIFITAEAPAGVGGRFNMFELAVETTDSYVTGNYAELKITADYGERKDVDTSFVFIFGAATFVNAANSSTGLPTQFAFNTINHDSRQTEFEREWNKGDKKNLYATGGSGIKPVIRATEIKEIVSKMIADAGIINTDEVVINKASIVLPYDMPADYLEMEMYPTVLSPTVRLRSSEGGYITYAGLTDSSVESEDQGEINRSNCLYSPDISHHVQEILKLKDEKNISNYDIWMLIMHDEVVEESSSSSSYDDYYNNLLYSSYYNNMMYGGYGGYGGYGYGGYGGYGYGGYGYGYNNYYNYMMLASLSSSYSTSETVTRSLDKDRIYKGVLNGPGSDSRKPQLHITFSAPKSAEK